MYSLRARGIQSMEIKLKPERDGRCEEAVYCEDDGDVVIVCGKSPIDEHH